jgi:hypothetical protein
MFSCSSMVSSQEWGTNEIGNQFIPRCIAFFVAVENERGCCDYHAAFHFGIASAIAFAETMAIAMMIAFPKLVLGLLCIAIKPFAFHHAIDFPTRIRFF